MRVRFYLTSSGRSPIEEFLGKCSYSIRSDFFDAVLLLESGKMLTMPLSRSLPQVHRGLHELRLRDEKGIVRIIYYVKKGDAIYMLHAFKKKTRQLPKKEAETALRRLRSI